MTAEKALIRKHANNYNRWHTSQTASNLKVRIDIFHASTKKSLVQNNHNIKASIIFKSMEIKIVCPYEQGKARLLKFRLDNRVSPTAALRLQAAQLDRSNNT